LAVVVQRRRRMREAGSEARPAWGGITGSALGHALRRDVTGGIVRGLRTGIWPWGVEAQPWRQPRRSWSGRRQNDGVEQGEGEAAYARIVCSVPIRFRIMMVAGSPSPGRGLGLCTSASSSAERAGPFLALADIHIIGRRWGGGSLHDQDEQHRQ
jgi:hypothetical protein